jgi:hypothetical protein
MIHPIYDECSTFVDYEDLLRIISKMETNEIISCYTKEYGNSLNVAKVLKDKYTSKDTVVFYIGYFVDDLFNVRITKIEDVTKENFSEMLRG